MVSAIVHAPGKTDSARITGYVHRLLVSGDICINYCYYHDVNPPYRCPYQPYGSSTSYGYVLLSYTLLAVFLGMQWSE